MSGHPLNRLEIDVMQMNELQEATELSLKHNLSAIIAHPGITSQAILCRGKAGGKFKIISPVDWPDGKLTGVAKFRGLSLDAIDVDGFEIMIGSRDDGEFKRNMIDITEFIYNHISPVTEIRFVIPSHNYDEETIRNMSNALINIRPPAFLRTDINLKLQISKANPVIHNNVCNIINSIINIPIKICGNINDLRSVTSCQLANRFGVSLQQAKSIIKEFAQNQAAMEQYDRSLT